MKVYGFSGIYQREGLWYTRSMQPNDPIPNLQEIKVQIEAIYNETMQKLREIETHKKEIVQAYIKELEQQKIDLIRQHLFDQNNHQ